MLHAEVRRELHHTQVRTRRHPGARFCLASRTHRRKKDLRGGKAMMTETTSTRRPAQVEKLIFHLCRPGAAPPPLAGDDADASTALQPAAACARWRELRRRAAAPAMRQSKTQRHLACMARAGVPLPAAGVNPRAWVPMFADGSGPRVRMEYPAEEEDGHNRLGKTWIHPLEALLFPWFDPQQADLDDM
jgi:hypothetical protein